MNCPRVSTETLRPVSCSAQARTHRPNLDVMPVDDGVDTHKLRPVLVGRVKMRQELAVRVRPPCSQKHRLHGWPVLQVCLEGQPHGQRIPFEVDVVLLG